MNKDSKVIIHGFDPGESTGYIKYNRDLCRVEKHDILKGYKDIHRILMQLNPFRELVIFENVVGKLNTQDQIQMCKLVGFIEGYCKIKNLNYIVNPPMIRTGFIEISKKYFLKNFKKSTYKKHNIDAFSHVLQYINKYEGIEKFT